jgi:hypothetical protein
VAGEQVSFEEIRDVMRDVRTTATVPQLAEWIEAVALDLARIGQEVRETTDAKTSVLTVLSRLAEEARNRASEDSAAQDALNGFADELDAAQAEIGAAVVANTPAETPGEDPGGTGSEPGSAGDNPTGSTPSGDSPVENTSGTVTLPTGGDPSTPDVNTVQP